jgi:hypothetical protein
LTTLLRGEGREKRGVAPLTCCVGWRSSGQGPPLIPASHSYRQTACIESFLPIGCCTFFWWKNPQTCCATRYPLPFGRHQTALSNIKCIVPALFGDRFGEKSGCLCAHNPPAKEVRWLVVFLCEAAQNFELWLKIQGLGLSRDAILSVQSP